MRAQSNLIMEYSKLVAVSGLPGLFEVISSKNDGAVVRSLVDKTTKFASSRIHQFSHLESIEIYTTGENVNLVDIFIAMDGGTALPDVKDDKAVKSYFEKVYPEMDFERVYVSDMKKIVKWFDILKKNDIEIKLTQPEETVTEEEAAEEVEKEDSAEKKEKPASEDKEEVAKKAPAKKKAAAKKKAE